MDSISSQLLMVGGSSFVAAPINITAPLLSGGYATTLARIGAVITCSTGAWANSPTTYTYQWRRGATAIGTNSASYTVVSADGAQTITCEVTANNAQGSSAPVASSNSYTGVIAGQQEFTTAGSYTFTVPAGVTSVCGLTVGGASLGGGALAWGNAIAVTPGASISGEVGAASLGSGQAGDSFFVSSSALLAGGASGASGGVSSGSSRGGGGNGGSSSGGYPGGGGAGGYSGNGGNGGDTPTAGAGGAGGGGQSGTWDFVAESPHHRGGGGGGVGLLGSGSNGAAGLGTGGAGGGGSAGGAGVTGSVGAGGDGGVYGGGGGSGMPGSSGAVRIIWGPSRSFPSTNTQNV